MIAGFLAWFAEKGATLLLGALAQFVRETVADARAAQAQRNEGRADAINDANKRSADQIAAAREAEAEAAQAHAARGEDTAFDQEFRRD